MNILQPLVLRFLDKEGGVSKGAMYGNSQFEHLIEQIVWELILDWSTLFRRFGPGSARVKPYRGGVNLHENNCRYVFWPYYEATHEIRVLRKRKKKRMIDEKNRREYVFSYFTTESNDRLVGSTSPRELVVVDAINEQNERLNRYRLSVSEFEFFLVPLKEPFPAKLENMAPEKLDIKAPPFPDHLLPYKLDEEDLVYPFFDTDLFDIDSENEDEDEDEPQPGEDASTFYKPRIDALQVKVRELSNSEKEYRPEKDAATFYKSWIAALEAKIRELE